MAKHRQQKVAQEILRTLASALLSEVKDPRLANVTLTDARVTADLQLVYIRWLCSTNVPKEDIASALTKATPFLRSVLSRLDLRRTPSLVFHYDDAFETGTHMSELLAKLRQNGEMGDSEPDPDIND
ncbi:MAG: 30S ribosome-binding factor RbfA [Proteobacteria bacterium]|nr:30S ribosome-binding factor RbfA [Pseudomonadota bacterium]